MAETPAAPPCSKCGKARIEGCVEGYIQVGDPRCPIHQGKTTIEPCEQCDGTGWLIIDRKPCRYMRARIIKQHLGPELANVQHVKTSPLLELAGPGEPPIRDLTGMNLLIRGCPWRNLLPHLKWALAYKGLNFSKDIITDERIKNVFVGNENYRHVPVAVRNHIVTVNSVRDLVGASNDLIIIRLGFLGYKNIAAAGALKEALMTREGLHLPTWLVEDPNKPWSHSLDGDLAHYISHSFTEVQIKPDADPGTPEITMADLGMGSDDEEGDELMLEEAVHTFQQESPTFEDSPIIFESSEGDDVDMGPLGGDDKPKWKKGRR